MLFLLLYSAVFSQPIYAHDNRLVFAIDIIRHGEHTPVSMLPTDNNPSPWKEGLGQLTARGMRQTFNLGAGFRKMYIEEAHLLPLSYQADSIHIRSADRDRTLMSTQSLLYGLYPLGTGPLLDDQIPALPKAFQPVPIHTVPISDDCLLYSNSFKEFDEALEKYVYSSQEWKDKTAEYKDKLQKWQLKTGKQLRLQNIVDLAEDLYIYEVHGLPLPSGLDEDDRKEIQGLAPWVASTMYKPLVVGQAGSQTLLSEIAYYLNEVIDEQTKLKYVLFSAFDDTILSLMSALKNPLSEIPPYGSNVKLLLFEPQPGSFILRITYNGNKVKIPACEKEDCTLGEFKASVEKSKS